MFLPLGLVKLEDQPINTYQVRFENNAQKEDIKYIDFYLKNDK